MCRSALAIAMPMLLGDGNERKGLKRQVSVASEFQRGIQARRGLLPRVALASEVVAVVEQGSHKEGVEILRLVLVLEVRTDVGQVEIVPIFLRRRIDPIEIADALRVE